MKAVKLDHLDVRILRALQNDSSLSQRELADIVGLSQNACWRRLRMFRESGLIKGYSLKLDRQALELGVTVFMMIRTRHHSKKWLETFRQHVSAIPEVIDFYRIGGDYDYLLKVVAHDINAYDKVYQRLIDKVELDAVTSYFAMEAIEDQRPLPLRDF
ncbi:Lrp/AsnC family transcriptional regulator [Oryzicola mucosus]|uniref:Lrp/AsnC family transcriptional regulator n=1 Tax=Oryzicola mucosus TaxID=2767425 RepID=A0A8J6TYG2_9HYPH|nr:Lrp/AsnC family transcriptional regulator [Oryzicola mucosus]MBD0414654.1 Lrp/AsnC family transcriptional regulator [Oryzicola mucosus]